MTAFERYMIAVAKKSKDDGTIARIQEIVRVMNETLTLISDFDPDDDIELCAEIVNAAINALTRCEDISIDGISEIKYLEDREKAQ